MKETQWPFIDGIQPSPEARLSARVREGAVPLDHDSNRARSLAERLALDGAVMTTPGSPVNRVLIGQLMWINPHCLFWFAAHGDDADAARLLKFDATQTVDESGVYFLANDQLLGCLSTIETAGVDDPDDYRIGWELWKQVAPLRALFIAECLDDLLRKNGLTPGSAAPFPS